MKKLLIILSISVIFTGLSLKPAFAQDQLVKEPNVSGTFYPQNKNKLSAMIDKMIAGVKPFTTNEHISGIICPHAGYIYSGKIAAGSYKAIYGKKYSTVIILAPSHYFNSNYAAVYPTGFFKTPLGKVPVNTNISSKLLKNSDYFKAQTNVFEREHAIEVQLPFLQKSLKNFSIVPIIIFPSNYSYYEHIGDILASIVSDREDILIIASTDMSHFHNQAKANFMDKTTLALITAGNAPDLFDNLKKGNCELCGGAAVITLMLTMEKIKAGNPHILDYATSADTVKSSSDQVVGYCSVIYTKSAIDINDENTERSKNMLTQSQRKELLSIARISIRDYLETGQRKKIKTEDALFMEKRGAFVTLNKNGMLRGCIGRIVSDIPLINVITDMAIEAASGDPRFIPVNLQELDAIDLEISVMSPIEEITDINRIKVGTHGLIISKGFSSGLLLPQVATEYNWSTEQFLQQTCIKAGLNQDTWKKGAKIHIFSAEVFGELD